MLLTNAVSCWPNTKEQAGCPNRADWALSNWPESKHSVSDRGLKEALQQSKDKSSVFWTLWHSRLLYNVNYELVNEEHLLTWKQLCSSQCNMQQCWFLSRNCKLFTPLLADNIACYPLLLFPRRSLCVLIDDLGMSVFLATDWSV